jgi:hypothetical protein
MFSTFALFGLIWVIQLLHYPSFNFISEEKSAAFCAFHSKSISKIVAPLMLTELFTAFLILNHVDGFDILIWLNLLTVLALWLLTFIVFVPLHSHIASTFSTELIQELVQKNWWRTTIWSLRVPLVLALFWNYKG